MCGSLFRSEYLICYERGSVVQYGGVYDVEGVGRVTLEVSIAVSIAVSIV